MRLLAEEEYFDAWQFVPVLCLAMVFAAFSTFLSSVYVVLKKSSLSFWTVLLGAGSNVILTLILIPRIGVMGAALATLASYILVFFVRAVSIRRLLPFPLAVPIVTLDSGLLSAQALLASPLISRWFPRWASCCFPAQAPLVFLLLILNARPLLLTAKKLFGARRKGESV